MRIIKSILVDLYYTARKIYYKLRGCTPPKIEAQIITKIRKAGGCVGANVDILASSIDMAEPYLIKIGNNVTITGVKILTHDASLKKTIGYSKVGKVIIGDDVFIGWGAIILADTTIGNKVVIGAGAVVARDIPDNSVVIGNPCRIICSYDEYVEKIKADMADKSVIDLYPEQIIMRKDLQEKLIRSGNGYTL